MRNILKWALRGGLVLTLVAVGLGIWKREDIKRLLTVNSLFDEDKIVGNFSNMEDAFLTVDVPRGNSPVSYLEMNPGAVLPSETEAWIAHRAVTSLLVLKDGQLVHESYHLGTDAQDRRISWSIAKSYLSALLGILLDEGTIRSLDDPVTAYVPELKGSAYDEATLKHLLQMTSGVKFNEDYLDYHSDINRMGRVLALGGTMDGFASDLTETTGPPGQVWHYVSIDTHVIGMVIRGATGRDLPSLLSERIIAPLGLEDTPYYLSDGEGIAFALGGLNMRSRDYARFGLMIAQNGRYEGRQIVPADWIAAATAPSAPTEKGKTRYGYQWWIPKDGPDNVFFARGIYGQYIYIDQNRGVVIVATAADRDFRDDGVNDQNLTMFRAIADSL